MNTRGPVSANTMRGGRRRISCSMQTEMGDW
jgi:hypothetical protein